MSSLTDGVGRAVAPGTALASLSPSPFPASHSAERSSPEQPGMQPRPNEGWGADAPERQELSLPAQGDLSLSQED